MNTQLLQGEELDAFYNRVMVQKDIDEYGDAVDYVPQEAVVQRIKLIIALAIRWLGIEMYVEPDEVEAITIEWPTEDEPVSFCVYRDDDSFYMVYRPDERVDKQFYFDYTLDHEKISESAEAYRATLTPEELAEHDAKVEAILAKPWDEEKAEMELEQCTAWAEVLGVPLAMLQLEAEIEKAEDKMHRATLDALPVDENCLRIWEELND